MEGSREQLAQNAKEIKQSLEAIELELKDVETALGNDSQNSFLLQKYARLSKKEQLLLEERALWTGDCFGHTNPAFTSLAVLSPENKGNMSALWCRGDSGKA